MMASGRWPRLLRLTLLGFVSVHFISVVYEANGFSMVRRYKLDDGYSSIQHLKGIAFRNRFSFLAFFANVRCVFQNIQSIMLQNVFGV